MSFTVKCVARGALLLDDYRPDWRDRIDVQLLDVASVRRCPVGQTFGLTYQPDTISVALEWRAALRTLGAPPRGRGDWCASAMHEWAINHGFDAGRNSFTLSFDWDVLNHAWRELLATS